MSERQILALTEEIYDAAMGEMPWSAIGRSVSRLLNASSGWLLVADAEGRGGELLYRGDFPDDEIAAYKAHYRNVDLWTTRTAEAVRTQAHASPKSRISGHLVPDAEYVSSEYYADQGRRLGLRYCVGTVLLLGDAGTMPIGFHRADGAEPFDVTEARQLDLLLPHIRRAMQLRHRLRPGPAPVSPELAALDALATAVVVVDSDMQVELANVAAETIIVGGSALRIVRSSGTSRSALSALQHADQARLSYLVKATASGRSAGGAIRLRDASLVPVVAALVSPLPRRLADGSNLSGRVAGKVIIFLRDFGARPSPPAPELLRELFGLTRREAQVACALYGGATKGAVGAEHGLRESTIRTHVATILSKTGTANLRDLERLIASLC